MGLRVKLRMAGRFQGSSPRSLPHSKAQRPFSFRVLLSSRAGDLAHVCPTCNERRRRQAGMRRSTARLTDARRSMRLTANRTIGLGQPTGHVPMRKVQRETMSTPATRDPAPGGELAAVWTRICPVGRQACGQLLGSDVDGKVLPAIRAPVPQDGHHDVGAVHPRSTNACRCSLAAATGSPSRNSRAEIMVAEIMEPSTSTRTSRPCGMVLRTARAEWPSFTSDQSSSSG
jgi:hypothetical protein